jgi:decaprenylphosphoryl-5-phosphoribose phosphatase
VPISPLAADGERLSPILLRSMASPSLDARLLRSMRTRGHSPALEAAAKTLATVGEWGAVWAAIGLSGAAADPTRRSRWLRGAAVGPGAIFANYAVKLAVRRPRPKLRGLPPLARAPSALSFPSAHATSSLAAATAFGRVDPRTRLPLYALAGTICLTRPYLGMHYPSDVLAGAALGVAIGGLVPKLGERSLEERLIDLVARGEER